MVRQARPGVGHGFDQVGAANGHAGPLVIVRAVPALDQDLGPRVVFCCWQFPVAIVVSPMKRPWLVVEHEFVECLGRFTAMGGIGPVAEVARR